MHHIVRTVLLAVLLPAVPLFLRCAWAEYPEKPLKIVVYTQPGGLIDISSRKLAHVLESKYLNVPVLVENKKGAGGIVALSEVLRRPADGYTIFGLTSSVISKAVASKQESRLEGLQFLVRLIDDYECLITNKKSKVVTFQQIVADAKRNAGQQIWVGPATQGTDHIFAQKFWNVAGIKAKWIPYRSGSEAIAALLGQHGVVYVGSPQDVLGRPDLQIAAVASSERLASFADVPTFRELGMDQLSGESLWRGFALKKGTPAERVQKLEELFRRATMDEEWREFVKKGSAIPIFETQHDFQKLVQAQIQEDKRILATLS